MTDRKMRRLKALPAVLAGPSVIFAASSGLVRSDLAFAIAAALVIGLVALSIALLTTRRRGS